MSSKLRESILIVSRELHSLHYMDDVTFNEIDKLLKEDEEDEKIKELLEEADNERRYE